jgi:hypothetical protein
MATSTSQTSFYQQLIDKQELTNKLYLSWMSPNIETLTKRLKSIEHDAYSEVLKAYSSMADLYRVPDYFDSSAFTRQDTKDGVVREKDPNSSREEDDAISSNENTSISDINVANQQFRQYLDSQTKDFIRTLTWTDFEDGMENDVTRQVGKYMGQNRYVTYCWLHKIFNDNRSKPNITSGILRTLAMVVNKNDADIMLTLVTSGIASQHSEDQEAAIMVVEKWRTKECLEALLNTTFGSDWVKEYAMQVVEELKEELAV